RLQTMSEEEQIKLLASNGMLVKRPLIIGDTFVLIGFKADDWAEALIK
ncbi:MAG: arsenate reductase family protein, partial [Alphaproteobacteria bacterium]|nr:arsenate reductase family protein [Alphaproteobacteria bacterium]